MEHPRFGYRYTIPIRRELRKKATKAEEMLWRELRSRKLAAFKFRRQCGVGPYIVDFCAREKRVIIEIDGGIHLKKSQIEWDWERQEQLEGLGYRFIRYQNEEVEQNLNRVLIDLLEKLADLFSTPPLLHQGEGEKGVRS